MIHIDGAQGEGGGQILRSSLTLSILTGKPVSLTNIRARRSRPGLMAQHLNAVRAAAAVGKARVEGAQLHSLSLVFAPQTAGSGKFQFDIGTAGSTSLLLQTILLPLSFAPGESQVVITGGTHVPWSPCFHYLQWHWLKAMRQIGFDFDLEMDLAGFYPQGGGRICATIRPVTELKPLCLTKRGRLENMWGFSAVANLDLSIAQRQKKQALKRLEAMGVTLAIEVVRMPAHSRGTMLLLLAEFEHSRCCTYALGARGKPAEQVADEAVADLEAFLATDATVDPYLADQLILPLALAPGSSKLHTSRVTQHLLTNAEVLRRFLPVPVEISGEIGAPGVVCILH
jgi:RNA 3'-phosphate cyclase